jgi:hypothetical protein
LFLSQEKATMRLKPKSENLMSRKTLVELGIIIEDPKKVLSESDEFDASEEEMDSASDEITNQVDDDAEYPEVDYDIQNEIIKFFVNNPGADPELFRQYGTSIGIDPDEFQKQENILLSQLLKIYTQDSQDLGYGSSLTDDEVSDEIRDMVTPDSEEYA